LKLLLRRISPFIGGGWQRYNLLENGKYPRKLVPLVIDFVRLAGFG
jgi:hypothetical protein